MKTRRNRSKARRNKRKARVTRRQSGAGESCYGNGKTWSCSAACGENGACQTYD